MTGSFHSKTFLGMALAASLMLPPAPASAELVSTDRLVTTAQTDSNRAELTALLARSDVRAQMTALGVNVDDAQRRVNLMTSAELAAVQSRLGTLPAGGVLGIVLGLIVIFFVLDLAGVTDIFPGV